MMKAIPKRNDSLIRGNELYESVKINANVVYFFLFIITIMHQCYSINISMSLRVLV